MHDERVLSFVCIRVHERLPHIPMRCRVLAGSRAGFYKGRASPLAERVKADAVLAAWIRAIHTGCKQRYGSPTARRALGEQSVRCGEKRVARLMREAGIRAIPTPR